MIFIALILLFTLTPKLKRYPKWIVFVGQNTIIFYIGHYWPRSIITLFEKKFHVSLPNNAAGYIFKYVLICFIMTVITQIFNRYFPFAVGRKQGRKAK